jgi:hypothetical protein
VRRTRPDHTNPIEDYTPVPLPAVSWDRLWSLGTTNPGENVYNGQHSSDSLPVTSVPKDFSVQGNSNQLSDSSQNTPQGQEGLQVGLGHEYKYSRWEEYNLSCSPLAPCSQSCGGHLSPSLSRTCWSATPTPQGQSPTVTLSWQAQLHTTRTLTSWARPRVRV